MQLCLQKLLVAPSWEQPHHSEDLPRGTLALPALAARGVCKTHCHLSCLFKSKGDRVPCAFTAGCPVAHAVLRAALSEMLSHLSASSGSA